MVVFQERVPPSSRWCRRTVSAAQPPKTRHIHCVSGFPHPQFQDPHVAFPSEVRGSVRLVVVLDEGLVLVQADLITSLRDLGTTAVLRLCPSSVRPVNVLSPVVGMESPPAPRNMSYSQGAHWLPRRCHQLLRCSPVLSWYLRTVPRLSKYSSHPVNFVRFLDLRVTMVHLASLIASCKPDGAHRTSTDLQQT